MPLKTTYNESLTNSNYSVWLLGLFLALSASLHAQVDSTETSVVKVDRGTITGEVKNTSEGEAQAEAYFHNPKKATIMSAALPGLGQIYNKKYWKLPIIYGGFAVAGYYLNDNIKQINKYKDAFKAETDGNPDTENDTGYSQSELESLIDQYKQWRDLSYIAIGAIYILNIIDASVDAHLFYFDVSEDISMNVQPYVNPFGNRSAGVTFSLKL